MALFTGGVPEGELFTLLCDVFEATVDVFAELVTEEALLPTTVWPSEVFRIATGRARFGGGGGGGGSIPGEKNCGNFVGLFTVGVEGLD